MTNFKPPTEENCAKEPLGGPNIKPPTENQQKSPKEQLPNTKSSTEDEEPPPILDSNCTSHYEISVAIDFGTSNCAVAYSYASDKQNVIVINDWQDGVPTHGKFPTAILFDEKQMFMAFGNRAIDKYREFVANEDQEKYYFFEKFKMGLYREKV